MIDSHVTASHDEAPSTPCRADPSVPHPSDSPSGREPTRHGDEQLALSSRSSKPCLMRASRTLRVSFASADFPG
jgi:hypothetical protein